MDTNKTLDAWITIYNTKTPEPFKRDERYALFFRPDKGFCEVAQTEDMFIINQLCGDARFWKDKVDETARGVNIKTAGTWCIRPAVLPYIRLFGYEVERAEKLPDGLKRYFCRHKTTNKQGLVSPAFRYEGGGQAYFITWEV